jgi:two-component system OmpR family sensor kinase
MAGREGGLSRSLEFRLFLWLTLAIVAIATPAGLLSYAHAFEEAIELQDDQLRQTVTWLQRQRFSAPPVEVAGAPDADPESRLIVLTAEPGGPWRPADAAPGLKSDAPDGLQTASIGGVAYRFVVGAGDGGRRIAVGQQTAVRDEIANKSAFRAVAPFLSLIVLLPLVIGLTIRTMLRPLKSAADELELRSEAVLSEIPDARLPTEVRPFVVAIKRLMTRVAASVAEQRRFLADAAHELRSPITSLSLQAERLEAADMSSEARRRLFDLRRGISRTRRLLDQLLTLERARADAAPVEQTSLNASVRRALEDLMPLAEVKRIDVGRVSHDDVAVDVAEIDLMTVMKNLIDNAIRYTPEGGRIDLAIETGPSGATFRVQDTGPGIRSEDYARAFDSFHRLPGADDFGSGLGLSIVKTIVDRLGGAVALGRSPNGGLDVAVTIPQARIIKGSAERAVEHTTGSAI